MSQGLCLVQKCLPFQLQAKQNHQAKQKLKTLTIKLAIHA
jgi:hypothetical protein